MTVGGTVTASASAPAERPAQLESFRDRCAEVAGSHLGTTTDLHAFSVTRYRDFWRVFLDWSELAWEGASEPVCTSEDVQLARFFPRVRLNYAENLLRPLPDAGDDAPALTSVHADGSAERLDRGELRAAVQRHAAALSAVGVGVEGRVVAIAPNNAATAIAALAVAALGATLSTATPDMGPSALIGRFGQVRPTVLLLDRTGMARSGATAEEVLADVLAGLPTVRQVLLLDDGPLPAVAADGREVARLAGLVAALPVDPATVPWPRLPFDHPLWVMFSSGTTGPPKAMVHGAGGSLLEHVKEHRLHGDLRAGDTLYFHTTTAWMMWNWQLSALAVGAHIVLNDGPVTGPESLWELVSAHEVTVFGTSPAYLQLCQDEGYRPADELDLGLLRAVMSTGAVLHDWQFAWIGDAVGRMPVQSISGGTDIIGCFVLGHPDEPVRPGRSQSLSLGLDVAALDSAGRPVLDEVGELVCRRPFPSRPVGFLDDPDGARFAEAYFGEYPGVWTHGDLIDIAVDGSARMHGRSDGLLKVNGIRIGPSEIYTIVRQLPEVVGAMAVEQQDPDAPGGTRLVLMVVPGRGVDLDDPLRQRIRAQLRREGSPAHVPAVILAVPQLPITHNGKYSERAARDALNGAPVRNLAALKNPGCLAEIVAAADAAALTSGPAQHRPVDPLAHDDVLTVVRRAFADVLGSPVDDDGDFFDAGGTSRRSMRLLRQLRLELERPLRMATFLAGPTISGVAAALATGDEDDSPVEVLRAAEADGDVAPLFLVHGRHGDVDIYRSVTEYLEPPTPVLGLTAVLHTPSGPAQSIVDLATAHVSRLDAVHPRGPVRLAGFSFGGLVAFEMARQLTAQGRQVAFLGLIDVHPPTQVLSPVSRLLYRSADRLAFFIPGMTRFSAGTKLTRRLRARGAQPTQKPVGPSARRLYNDYRWDSFAGPVTYFRASRRIPVVANALYAWRRVVPDLTVVEVPGAHSYLLDRENAPVLAARLSEALRPSGAPRPTRP